MATNQSKLLASHIKALEDAKLTTVEVGWFESNRYPAGKGETVGISVASVARIQEFGASIKQGDRTIVIPPRPFMRKAWSDFSSVRHSVQAKVARKLVSGEINAEQALKQIGMAIENHIALSIKKGGWQKNADWTVKQKGFDKPLIASGNMWQTINTKVS